MKRLFKIILRFTVWVGVCFLSIVLAFLGGVELRRAIGFENGDKASLVISSFLLLALFLWAWRKKQTKLSDKADCEK